LGRVRGKTALTLTWRDTAEGCSTSQVESRGAGDAAEAGEAGSRGGNRDGGDAGHNRHDWVSGNPMDRSRSWCRGRLLCQKASRVDYGGSLGS
jgi:hypothetical protein